MGRKVKTKSRVNISVDKQLLDKAKKKLNLFGGKLSTLFNAYLADFVASMDKAPAGVYNEVRDKIKELEGRIRKLEGKS